MRLGRVLVGLLAGLTLLGFCITAWQLLRPDPLLLQSRLWQQLLREHGRDAIVAEQARHFHRSDSKTTVEPCLRYVTSEQWSDKDARALAQRLVKQGFAERLSGRLAKLVDQWRQDHVNHHHALSLAEERVRLLQHHLKGLDGFLVWFNRDRVVSSLEDVWRWRRAPRQLSRGKAPPAAEDVRKLRGLWQRHKLDISEAGQLSMEIPLRELLTGRRMSSVIDQLKRWVDREGRPPTTLDELDLSAELHNDGFGEPFSYEPETDVVRVISPGFDGIRGTGDDRIWGFSWP